MMAPVEPVNFLIVDDMKENLLSLEALLKRDGLNFLKASSGEAALEILLKHDVALALLDVQMPGMDGFQLAEFMRGSERTKHVPIIFVTAGAVDNQRRFRGYEAGAVDFIQKPIEPDVLRGKTNVFFDLHQQKRQIIAQRDALEASAEVLRTIDRHRNQFIAILGHELRNPVMALGGGLELLKRSEDADRAQYIRTKMERQVLLLGRLVEDLIDISRIDQGRISLKKTSTDLGTILHSAIESSHPLVEAGGHTLTFEDLPEPIPIFADQVRMAQVVSNLLSNAAKYTPAGGRISLSAARVGDTVEIKVGDNGVGIPVDLHSDIFEIFIQARDDESEAKDGLGIGLALVKQLVELHGGTISVESGGQDKGSCFTVRLPIGGGQTPAMEAGEFSVSG